MPSSPPLQQLDARIRLLLLLAISVTAALIRTLPPLYFLLSISLIALGLSGQRLSNALMRIVLINGLLALAWLSALFFTPGEILWRWGAVQITQEGLQYALTILLRGNVATLAILAFWADLSPSELGRALASFRLPPTLIHLLLLTDRYLHVLLEESHRIRNMLRIRGFTFQSRLHTYRTLGYVVGMLLVRSHIRSKKIEWAMRCRGFKGLFAIEDLPLPHSQVVLTVVFSLFCLGLLALDHVGRFRS